MYLLLICTKKRYNYVRQFVNEQIKYLTCFKNKSRHGGLFVKRVNLIIPTIQLL